MLTGRQNQLNIQRLFSGDDYGFRWVGDWYEYDSNGGALARKARDQEAKRLKSEGWTVKKFSLGQQLVSKGGIGSGRPHIELFVPCYGLNAWKMEG